MKKILAFTSFAFMAIAVIARNDLKAGIHGSIDPPEGAKKIWAISGTDSVSTVPVAGRFAIEVKPGTWTLIVEGAGSYKNAVVNNVQVMETQSTDVGLIRLQSKPQ